LYTEALDVYFIYRFEDAEQKDGQFGMSLIDSYRDSIKKYTELLRTSVGETEKIVVKKMLIFFHKEIINLKQMPATLNYSLDSLQNN
jgi:hypothetical protein